MPKDASVSVRVVGDEPSVEPAFDEVDHTAFLKWDEWSERIASSGQFNPPWFRQKGLDDGEILLFSPIQEHAPDGADKDEHARSRWDAEGVQIAEVCGPTKRSISAVLTAPDDASKERANIDLVAQCLTAMPEGAVAKRDFTLAQKVVLEKNAQLPAPMDFHAMTMPDGIKAAEVIPAYVTDFLPDRVRKMVHTAALCMAVPEIEFVVLVGEEKGAEEEAKLRSNVPKKAGEDDNFTGESSGSSVPK